MSSQVSLFLVKDLYSEHAFKIAEALIARPNSHLSQIKLFTKLDIDLLRQTLIIMLKSNIVEYSVNSDLPSSSEITNDMDMNCFYSLNKSQLFHISRLSNYLSEVQAKYSNYGKYSDISKILLETLAVNGMLTAEDCVGQSLDFMEKCENELFDFEENDLYEVFSALLKENYIMPKTISIKQVNMEELKSNLKKRGKPSSTSKIAGNSLAGKVKPGKKAKINMLSDNTENYFEDFMKTLEVDGDAGNVTTNQEGGLFGDDGPDFFGKGEKQTEVVTKDHSMFRSDVTGETYIFSINFRKIVNDIRTKFIVNMAKERVGVTHSQLMHIILKKNNNFGKGFEIRHTEGLTLEEIICAMPGGSTKNIDRNKIAKVLDDLNSDSTNFIRKTTTSIGATKLTKYSVNLEKIVYVIQLKNIERVIQKKFGDGNYTRVFRAMQTLSATTDKQIEQVCLLSPKDSRAILINLMKEGLVDQFEYKTSKGGTNYAYTLKIAKFMRNFLEPIYKMKLNIMTKEKELETKLSEIRNLENVGLEKGLEREKVEFQLKKFRIASNEIDYSLLYFTEF